MLGTYLALAAAAVIILPPLAAPQPTPWRASTCASGTYAANSTYQGNLGFLAAALPANVSVMTAGFATATVGVVPDLISALALCRGDTNASTCRACVAAGFPGAQRDCPNRKDVIIYQDDCVLRFSDQRFLDFVGVNSPVSWISGDAENLAVSAAWFNAATVVLMNATVDLAVTMPGNSTKKYFATGEENFDVTHYPKIYGLAQCVPEMTAAQCRSCLGGFIPSMTWFLKGSPAGRALGIWCNLRYSVNPFYTASAMVKVSAPPASAPATVPSIATAEPGTGRNRRVAGISAGASCFAILVLILMFCAFIRLERGRAKKHENAFNKMARGKCTIYDFPTLQNATGNFSEQNKLGEGGFGTVYKGDLPGGQEIAVKKLIDSTGQGLDQIRNEVMVLVQLQHKNLVRLQGFCLHQNEMLLVYEYIKNGSLDNFLFEDSSRRNTLNWDEEYNIILGIAKGIMYLHEDSSVRIIHRDLKANNILLGDAMDPKIADFGLARLQLGGHTQTNTTRVVGTYGYMAPEYAMNGNVSPKIDIFSFGVLTLEIVTKRRNCSYDGDTETVNLLSDVWTRWTKGTLSEMIDQSLEGHSRIQALRCVHIGLLCVQSDPDDRPDIPSIIFMLNREDMELQPPSQPAFFFGEDSISASPPCQQGMYVYNRSKVIFENISVNGLTITYPFSR